MKGLRTKKIQGSHPALLDHEIGIPQQRGEKLGRRTEYIAARRLSTGPPPFSKLLSSFTQSLSVKEEEIAFPMV